MKAIFRIPGRVLVQEYNPGDIEIHPDCKNPPWRLFFPRHDEEKKPSTEILLFDREGCNVVDTWILPDELPEKEENLPPELREELERRLKEVMENPDSLVPWEDVKKRLEDHIKITDLLQYKRKMDEIIDGHWDEEKIAPFFDDVLQEIGHRFSAIRWQQIRNLYWFPDYLDRLTNQWTFAFFRVDEKTDTCLTEFMKNFSVLKPILAKVFGAQTVIARLNDHNKVEFEKL